MSAIDACEPQVLRALQKGGWSILDKPFTIRSDDHTVFADCILERMNNGNSEQVIILEVKCFTNSDADLQEFYTAIGQYLFYRAAVTANLSTTPVYLAIPSVAYARLTNDQAIRIAFQQSNVKLVIVDVEREEIVQWLH